MNASDIEAALERIEAGEAKPLYLVVGDQVLALKAATRIADALAKKGGCEPAVHRRPGDLGSILADLLTFSMFDQAKVRLVVDSAVFADRTAAAGLIDEVDSVLPVVGAVELTRQEREAAGRLLQALRLFGTDPSAGSAADVISSLPTWALSGGSARKRRRTKKQTRELADGLVALLEAARAEELSGWADSDLAELDRALDDGFPDGHALVFAERSGDSEHPLVKRLRRRGAFFDVGSIAFDRSGRVAGLEAVLAELAQETGVRIDRPAAQELANRTLRKKGGGWGAEVDAASADRLASEYRKLAESAGGRGGSIHLATVREMVTDRGEEDVWKLLDAVAEQETEQALTGLRRLLDAAPRRDSARMSFFALFASFCEQLAVAHGIVQANDLPPERNFNRFKARILPRLNVELPGGAKNPLGKLNPYRAFKVYQAASARQSESASRALTRLPWQVLETEVRLKGASTDGDSALEALLATVADAGAGNGPGRRGPVSRSRRRLGPATRRRAR